MRLLARILLFLTAMLVLMWLCRTVLYRAVVHYRIVGERSAAGTLSSVGSAPLDVEAAIRMALDTTASRLHFSTGRVSSAPEKLNPGSPANCIGYAALFASLLRGHFAAAGLDEQWSVDHVIGTLYLGDRDLHKAFDSSFWKDHDIVRITDTRSGSMIYIDPTLYDALGIGRVSGP